MSRLILLTTKDCYLCVRARADLDAVARRTGVAWAEVDVADDPELAREYGDRLPVVLLDGREHGYWDVDVERLERDLGAGRAEESRLAGICLDSGQNSDEGYLPGEPIGSVQLGAAQRYGGVPDRTSGK